MRRRRVGEAGLLGFGPRPRVRGDVEPSRTELAHLLDREQHGVLGVPVVVGGRGLLDGALGEARLLRHEQGARKRR